MTDTVDIPTYKIAVSRYQITQKIPLGSDLWGRFNGSFSNMEIHTDRLMDMIWRGHAITSWHTDHWRNGRNFLCGQWLGMDFDTEDERSTLAALAADKFIQRYAAVIYTTMSHTPEKPRARVIFVLDTPIQQAENYKLASTALLWMYGAADASCKDAARFFYGSPNCDFEFINSELPLEIVKKLVADYRETGKRERKRAGDGFHAPASQAEVQAALQYIKPWDIDYSEWLSVLMAIHAEFGEAGLGLAESWADGYPGEVERKWDSFHDRAGGVTIATVFGIAKQFGWKRSAAVQNVECKVYDFTGKSGNG